MNNFLSPFRHFFTPKPKKKPELFLRSSFLQLSVPVDKNVYVMSDIHGQYEAFLHMLWKIRFHQDKDLLILNGDLIDCGPDSYALLEYAMHEPVVFTLYGNHELNLVNAYSSFSFQAYPHSVVRSRKVWEKKVLGNISPGSLPCPAAAN